MLSVEKKTFGKEKVEGRESKFSKYNDESWGRIQESLNGNKC